jgi:hypothetical protein
MADEVLPREFADVRTLCPEQLARWEETPDGRVVLLRPKFTHPFMVRWVLPRLKKRDFRIALDAAGSLLWKASDGHTTVETIGLRLQQELGLAPETVFLRIAVYLQNLEREKFIRVRKPSLAE